MTFVGIRHVNDKLLNNGQNKEGTCLCVAVEYAPL